MQELSRWRASRNVKKMAIKISTAPATERERVTRACTQNTEVVNSENRNHSYRIRIITLYDKGNDVYYTASK